MKLAQTLETLRGKPDHIKGRIAFLTSLVFSSFVFVIWASSLSVSIDSSSYTYGSPDVGQNQNSNTPLANIQNSVSAITAKSSSLGASAGDVWESVKSMTSSIFTDNKYEAPQDAVKVTPGTQNSQSSQNVQNVQGAVRVQKIK